MHIQFCGASGEVTGSCFMVESEGKKILVDCGMFQGSEHAATSNTDPFLFDATEISAVLVTHAHIDHCGRVPLLFERGFRGPVYATEPGAALIRLQWDDMLGVMTTEHRKHGNPMLYQQPDVDRANTKLVPKKYSEKILLGAPGEDFFAIFHDAGHIFGSAFIELHVHGKVAVFSGDMGNDDVPIVKNSENLVDCDVLVMEATYGDRLHGSPRQRREDLRKIIIESVKRGGALLIPAFSIERTQEILFEFNQLIEFEHALPRIPIFLDGPLAIHANAVYRAFPQYYDSEAAAKWKAGDYFLDFPGLKVTLTTEESKTINSTPNPKVIIAGSGMMSGGRIMHHLMRYLSDPNSTVALVSYQAEGTLGRRVQDRAPMVTINGEQIPVRCHIERLDSYSAHGDQNKLLAWAGSAPHKPGRIIIVHADPSSASTFAELVTVRLKIPVQVARFGEIADI